MAIEERFQNLAERVARWASDVDRRVGEAQLLARQGRELQGRVVEHERLADAYAKVMKLFQTFSETEQEQLRYTIEALVTKGLRVVFGDDLSFRVIQKIERNQVVLDFQVVSEVDGRQVSTDVLGGRGGGLANVCGFLLRLLVVVLMRDRLAPVLLADEEFDQLSDEYVPRAGKLLRMLCDQLGVQVIMVTHKRDFVEHADRAYRFALAGGVTKVESLKG